MQPTQNIILQWVETLDPGFLALRRSLKTFIAILVSVVVFRETPGMAMFAAISAMLISRSQAGFTIRERRFTMLVTGITMALLSVPVSLASQNNWTALAYVLVAAFVTFFLIGTRVVPDFPAVTLLALSVVEMAFSKTLETGLRFSALFALTTGLVYLLHFVLWPTRPRNRLKAQIEIILKNLRDYNKAIRAAYPDAESGMLATQERSDNVRKSIGDFRRLWQLFGLRPDDRSKVENRYLDIYTGLGKIHEFLILIWQFRVSVWQSEIYRNKILSEKQLDEILEYLIDRHDPAIIKPSDIKMRQMQERITATSDAYLNQIKSSYQEANHADWVSVINAVKALETLAADLQQPGINRSIEIPDFKITDKFKSFFSTAVSAFRNIRTSKTAFQLGIRSMLIIGATMAWSVFRQPDYGYWLVLFAVLLIRPNLGISIKVGRERLIGTFAGSILALGFVWIFPAGSAFYIAVILFSVFLMIWSLNINRMVPMVTFLSFMIIGLFYMIYPDGSNLVWLRILYTIAIVLLVIIASFLIWPQQARKTFARSLADALELEKSYFSKTINTILQDGEEQFLQADQQEIRNRIQRLNDTIDATKNEVLQEKVIIHGLNIRSYIMRLLNTLQTMKSASSGCELQDCFSDTKEEFRIFSESVLLAFDALIAALQYQTDVSVFPDLRADFENLRQKFKSIKYSDGKVDENISRLWKNSTLIWIFKPLILELEGIKIEINLKMQEV